MCENEIMLNFFVLYLIVYLIVYFSVKLNTIVISFDVCCQLTLKMCF